MKLGFSMNRGNGGPSLFMQKIRESIVEQKLCKTSLYFDPTVSANLFCNRRHHLPWRKPYFFRADGVYFDIKMPSQERNEKNAILLDGLKNSAGVIFQSEFSKKMYRSILGYEHPNSTIITNGVNLKKFNSNGISDAEKDRIRNTINIKKDSFVFVTSASWRTHKRLRDIINVFLIIKERNPRKDLFLIVIGDHDEQIPSDKNIISVGRMPNDQLKTYLCIADIYIFFSWLDTCPNSVVEAIASRVPVLCTDQGGTREIVEKTHGGIVAIGSDKGYDYGITALYTPPKPDYDILSNCAQDLIDNNEKYKESIDVSEIDISQTAKKYIDFISNGLKQ